MQNDVISSSSCIHNKDNEEDQIVDQAQQKIIETADFFFENKSVSTLSVDLLSITMIIEAYVPHFKSAGWRCP